MLDVLIWTAIGLAMGWLVRRLFSMRRDAGLAGDLVTGWLGGVLGGWLFRLTGLVGPDDAVSHLLGALAAAGTGRRGMPPLEVASRRMRSSSSSDGGPATATVASRAAKANRRRARRPAKAARHPRVLRGGGSRRRPGRRVRSA